MGLLNFKFLKIFIALIIISQLATAEDWPMFQHDLEHTGETSDVIENPEDLVLKWKFESKGGIFSSPVVSGDYVYMSSMQG